MLKRENIFLALAALLLLSYWLSPHKAAVHEGDACGPHHHWVWIGDLSCEDDDR
jgi:hypothetical protein